MQNPEIGQRIFPTGMFLENLHGGDPLPVRQSVPAPEPVIVAELVAEIVLPSVPDLSGLLSPGVNAKQADAKILLPSVAEITLVEPATKD